MKSLKLSAILPITINRKDMQIMEIILKTTGLCKEIKGQTVVDNVDIHIERNSVYGLLGPNGA